MNEIHVTGRVVEAGPRNYYAAKMRHELVVETYDAQSGANRHAVFYGYTAAEVALIEPLSAGMDVEVYARLGCRLSNGRWFVQAVPYRVDSWGGEGEEGGTDG